MRRPLRVWIPTNRKYDDGTPKGMDGWNELIAENRKGLKAGARIERENVCWCAWYIKQAMAEQGWAAMREKAYAVRCKVYMRFIEPNSRRDVPNVYGQQKYVLDALTARNKYGAGAIFDDSQRWLDGNVHMSVGVEHERAGIEVTVIPMEDEDEYGIG